jgi:hypothetical protein
MLFSGSSNDNQSSASTISEESKEKDAPLEGSVKIKEGN